MKLHLHRVALLALLVLQGVLYAADDLPPVPFIIGGDDVVSPQKLSEGGPLMLPEALAATTIEDVKQSTATPTLSPSESIDLPTDTLTEPTPAVLSGIIDTPLFGIPEQAPVTQSSSNVSQDVVLPPVAPEVATVAPVIALDTLSDVPTSESVIAAAPVDLDTMAPMPIEVSPPASLPVSTPVADSSTQPMLPVLATSTPEGPRIEVGNTIGPVETSGTPLLPTAAVLGGVADISALDAAPRGPTPTIDASLQPRLENTIGRSNPLLPPVVSAPAVAAVAEEFPSLYVDQIPLSDLLAYLRDFTPKTIRYLLKEPLYVTIDLKANSVDEVLAYIKARYPIEVVSTATTLEVRPIEPVRPVLATTAIAAISSPSDMPSTEVADTPIVQQPPVAPSVTLDQLAASSAPIEKVSLPPVAPTYDMPGVASTTIWSAPEEAMIPAISSDIETIDQLKLKARLYELSQERAKLLAQKEELELKARTAQVKRRLE